ncbi:MAG: enoyl-CoA hydratase/isomerase family protein, partial [Halioglobus sp.]|nr:enoyl-CoA hydratase/isomerase family protein [Halioglobus sp.]
MSAFHYEKDADGIVTVTMDMTGPVNAMNDEYRAAMQAAVERLEQEEGLTGVVIASAKKVFLAGGDLRDLLQVEKGQQEQFFAELQATKGVMRRLEKLPVPVAAAINGAALGGGFELCLCCNYRIAWDNPAVQIGLPEVSLGLLPGGGGIVRMVNLLGLEQALPYLLEGTRVEPSAALAQGMIHAVVDEAEQLVPQAKAWIVRHRDDEQAAVQPWDRKGHRIPGGDANSPKVAQLLMVAPAALRQKTRGLLPAP